MNDLDSQILEKTDSGYVILKRYLDDYFAFLLSKCISGERLLTIANGLDDNINFTL
jgi:hypothetical protein